MVEPIDAQNMLSRTPLVERTAAAQKDQAVLLNQPDLQIEKEKQHMQDKVVVQQGLQHVGDDKQGHAHGGKEQHASKEGEHGPTVELVQESAEEPEHKLDVTI